MTQLSFEKLAFTLDKIDLIKQSAAIKLIQLDAPEIHLTREKDGGINLTRIFSVADTKPNKSITTAQSAPKPALLPAIDINQIDINNGRLIYADSTLAKPFDTSLHDIKLGVTNLSTIKKLPAKIQLTMQGTNGAVIEQQGELTLVNSSASGQLSARQIHLTDYAAFAAPYLLARIEDGSLDVSSRYAVNWSDHGSEPKTEEAFKLDDLALTLNQLRLRLPDDKEPLFSGEQIAITGGSFQPGAHAMTVESVKLVAPKLGVKRNAQGLNLLALQPLNKTPSAPTAQAGSTTPLMLLLKSLQVEKGSINFEDASTSIPVKLQADNLNLSAQNISTAKGAAIAFDLKSSINKKGQLGVKGTAAIEPLSLTASINASKLGLASLHGYAADRLNVSIVNADLSLRGAAHLMTINNQMSVAFKGSADLTDVNATDRVTDEEFLRFKALKLGLIDVQYPAKTAPLAVTLNDIAFSDFYARIILNSNARLNLQDIVQQPGDEKAGQKSITTAQEPGTPNKTAASTVDAAPSAAAPSTVPPIIRLGQITLINGRINYTDNLIRPNYSANLTELGGVISGMASDQPTPADVNIRGSIDGDGALTISGKINPLGVQLYTDIAASAKDIELTKLTAYSVKYAGYPIEKGKLSMKVSYKIENGKLDANNNIFLDQLTFGDKVESPTATSLPVRFAVSLLQNSRGEIDIDLPISGTLNDPEFSIGGVIIHVIVNLLTRAITSPFSLLASAFGGGDELGYIEFAPGTATLAASDQTKIEKMVKALADRPSLKLDIIGRTDAETDSEGARQAQLVNKVRAQKIKDQPPGDDADASIVQVSADEYPKYLERAYSDEKFAKPRNLVGLAKTLPTADMEKLILANVKITDDDLRTLANQRADAVRNAIEKIDPKLGERVFLVAPKLNAEGIKDKGKASRVDFALK